MPEQTALVFGEVRVSYGRLAEAVRRLANGLRSLGVAPGDRVAILLPNVPHFPISYYAVLALGAVAVPVNFLIRPQGLRSLLADSGAKVLITWDGFRHLFTGVLQEGIACQKVVVLGEHCPSFARPLTLLMQESGSDLEFEPAAETVPAAINYTAGTAHDSLGAVMTHQALLTNMQTSREMFHINENDRIAAVIPMCHSLAQVLCMHLSLLSGATLVLISRFQPKPVMEILGKEGVTFLPAVPSLIAALADTDETERALPDLKAVLCYGGRVDELMVKKFEERFSTRLFVGYGLTEAGPLVSCHRLYSDYRPNSVGQPLVGTEVQILDETGTLLSPYATGEIWVKSPSIMSAYYNHPDQTALQLKDGWLFTGDIGYIDLDHYLYVVERKEDLIVKSGFPIFPHEVEDILCSHSAVAEAAVVGVGANAQSPDVKAFIVLCAGAQVQENELIELCKQALPMYKCPRFIEFCSALPKSPTGRVLKRLLRS